MQAPFALLNSIQPVRVSKHRRRDEDGNYIPGKCIVSDRSSLRKLMRAARRGKLPAEILGTIERAQESAQKRRHVYMTPYARFGEALRSAAQ